MNRGWHGESERHSLAARGILSSPRTIHGKHTKYGGLYSREARNMGRRLKRAGITDEEELIWEAGPPIREMSGYKDPNYTGRFGSLPKGPEMSFIKEKEQELWDEFWNGYNE